MWWTGTRSHRNFIKWISRGCFYFFSGLLDSITSTANSADCPGVCVHTFATLICYEVLEDVECPASMRCCIEAPINGTGTSGSAAPPHDDDSTSTIITTVKTTTTTSTTTPSTTTALTTVSSTTSVKATSVCSQNRIFEIINIFIMSCKWMHVWYLKLDHWRLQRYYYYRIKNAQNVVSLKVIGFTSQLPR